MDDDLIRECIAKASGAYKKSLIVTAILPILPVALAVAIVAIAEQFALSDFVRMWVGVAVISFLFCCFIKFAYRVADHLTFGRFIDRQIKEHRGSFYTVAKLHRQPLKQRQEDAFKKRVFDFLRTPQQ